MNLRFAIVTALSCLLLLPRSGYSQEPGCQASGLLSPTQTSNSITITWSPGCGTARMLMMAPTGAPICQPTDGIFYGANTNYSTAPVVCLTWRSVVSGPFINATVNGLTAGTAYDFYLFEYNDSGPIDYRTFDAPFATFATTGGTGPTLQAGLTLGAVTSGSVTLSIIPGNGDATLVGAQTGNSFLGVPANNIKYCAQNNYPTGQNMGAAGAFAVGLTRHGLCGAGVMCQENGTNFTVTGLTPGIPYTFKAFELQGCSSPSYNITSGVGNPVTVNIPYVEPGIQASSVVFSSVTTSSMTVSWTNGNGQNRTLVASATAPVSFGPVDGTTYSSNADFSLSPDLGAGNKILYAGPLSTVNVTGLTAGVTYNFRVYESNGPGFDVFTNYALGTAIGNPASRSTLVAEPTIPATAYSAPAVTLGTTSLTLNWTNGNGTSRMVIMDDGPLVFSPVDGVTYTANANYTLGTDLGSGAKCVFNGSTNSVAISGLIPGTTYNFEVIEYNGTSLTTNYLFPTPFFPFGTLFSEPLTQATNVAFSNVAIGGMTVSWTNGTGTHHTVVAHANTAVSFTPIDGIPYTANTDFTLAADVGSANKVVYSGTGSSVNVTGLGIGTTYHFRVFESNPSTAGTQTNYLPTTGTGNPANRSTLAADVVTQASNITFSSIQAQTLTANWTNGTGTSRMVVMDDQPITFAPVDGTDYPASANYSTGTDLGSGQVCVFNGAGTTVPVTGLTANTTYYFRVFEYNGSVLTANYNPGTATNNPNSVLTLEAEPTVQASTITFSSLLIDGFTISWTPGNGTSRVVIIDDAAISFTPTDATTLTANVNYAAGTDLGVGQKCVYNGSGSSVAVTGLATNTTYSIRIYEYKGTAAQTNYAIFPGTGNPTTHKTLFAEPTAHAASFTATAASSTQINLAFSAASTITNGTGYILLRRSDLANPTATGVTDGQIPGSLPLTGGTTLVTTITSNATTSFNDIGLASGVQYNYALIPFGFDGVNNETYNYRTAVTIPVANATTFVVEPATQPTAMVFSTLTPTSFTASFTPPGTTPAAYIAFRKIGSSPTTAIPVDGNTYTVGGTLGDGTVAYIGASPTFNDSGLAPGIIYFYDVFAYNGTGGITNYLSTGPLEGSQTTLVNPPANQPTAITFSSVLANTFTLSYTASVGGATGYLVLRRTGAAPTGVPTDGTVFVAGNPITDGTVVSVGASLSVPEAGLASNTTYFYAVFAYNGGGGAINYVTLSPLSGSQLTRPQMPTSRAPTLPDQTLFTANWDAIAGITNFFIDVSSDNYATYATGFQNQPVTGTSVVVSGLTPGTNYTYRIRAGNAAGQSVNSADQSALTVPATPTSSGPSAVTQSGFTAAWNAEIGVDNFFLEIASDIGFSNLLVGFDPKSLTGATLTSAVSGLASGTTFYYRVRAKNASGTSPNSLTVTVPTVPSPPVIDIPTDNRTSNSFLVTWSAITGATSYFLDVYDITGAPVFVPGYQNKSVTGTFYNVTGLTAATNYQVILRSANSSGPSIDSNIKFTQTKDASGNETNPPPTVSLGTTASISSVSASVASGTDPKTIVLYHRKITDPAALTADASVPVANGTYVVDVPSANIDEIGMEYYFEVTDIAGRKSNSAKGYVYRSLTNEPLPNLSAGGKVENYRIFSMPIDFGANNAIGDIFASVLSQFKGYNKEKWRLIRYQGKKNVDYTEGLTRIEKGRGYWFNSVEGVDMQVSGGVIPANQDAPFQMQLEDGWNQIGNPFTFNISWADVKAKNPLAVGVGPLYVFNPAVKFDQSDNLRAWGGGFVHSDGAVTLTIPVTVTHGSGRIRSEEGLSPNLGSESWYVPMKVVQGSAVNDISGFGMNPSAANGKDLLDELSLPRFVNYLEFNGYHPEYSWPRFMRDVVTTAKSHFWNFKVESNFDGPSTTLSWDPSGFGDNEARLVLFDEDAQAIVDMRRNSSYTFFATGEKNLRIVYALSGADFTPGFSGIGQPYPNPFSNRVRVPVILADQSDLVEISVYDMMGRKVWQGTSTDLPPGVHTLEWNGMDAAGSVLPDAVYIYRARISDGTVRQGRIVMKKN